VALVPTLAGATYEGTLGARGRFSFDSRKLDDAFIDYAVNDECAVVAVPPALARERFQKPFQHRIYLPDGSVSEETTGPGTSKWTPLSGISPFVQVAVQTTEDGGFYRHHGFSQSAVKASIIANLKARKFLRGASTISMQLAKNLFLVREKTLSRKFEEMILTDYLEQVLGKRELMELYLNVIEFGPSVYGITSASYYYFGRSPGELNLAESLFLSSMLPAPLKLSGLRSGGQLDAGWQKTLEHLMEIAHRNGLISDSELEEGKQEIVVFRNTGPRGFAQRHSDPIGDDGTTTATIAQPSPN
jgi:membrane peptidoglycan carboxypeptidase